MRTYPCEICGEYMTVDDMCTECDPWWCERDYKCCEEVRKADK